MATIENLRHILASLHDSGEQSALGSALEGVLKELPPRVEYVDLFRQCLALIRRIDAPSACRHLLLRFVDAIPHAGLFEPLYLEAMEAIIIAADAFQDNQHRTHELLKLAHELPKAQEFLPLRRLVWRLALGLPDRPRFAQPVLKQVAWELPKSSDYTFYRRFTLLGVAAELPKEAEFRDLYREAILLALDAIAVIPEPYYRKYSLLHIAGELRASGEFPDLYRRVVAEACTAAYAMDDPLAREHALVEVLRELPKTHEFSDLLMTTIEHALEFFTVRKWMEDVEATDVVDFILSAEEPGMKDSKKRRYSREKFSAILAAELEKFGPELSDVRFIEVLRPYTHIWVQPKKLRDSVRGVVAHLEGLKGLFHGREIDRPVFVREEYIRGERRPARRQSSTMDCISIDLGATNTVIMRKRGAEQPEFIVLPSISRKIDSVSVIPTILSAETNTIGAEVIDENPITNTKQMLLDRNPKGKLYMERFFRVLSQHLKRATMTGGWFQMVSRSMAEVLYISAPVGFQHYKKTLKEIAEKAISGVSVELIEEPLAAAIGYQVVEDRDKVVMIIDFGGSTLNALLVRVNAEEVHVVAKPERSQMLGGHDIDHWLAEHLVHKVGISPDNIPYRLIALAEKIKIDLSVNDGVPFIWGDQYVGSVSRHELEGVLDRHEFYKNVDRTISNVLKKAEKVGIKKEKIEAVLLTGGSSQIPSFREKVGHLFPDLRKRNLVYDHNPLSAVALGAALYGTKEVTDRHLSLAYAVRHTTGDRDVPHTYSIILEKGESLPVEKIFRIKASHTLGLQKEIDLQLFEVPEHLIVRRWTAEGGIEFIKQELQETKDISLTGLKTVTLSYSDVLADEVEVTFQVAETGQLALGYGPENNILDTGIRLR